MNLYDVEGRKLTASVYDGKKLSILGDSISTFKGYIPSGQSYEYSGSNRGVNSVDDTWWMKLIHTLGMTLLVNNSWSGTCVTNNRDSVKGENSSAMVRSELLGDSPDVIILYMGINDFNFEVALGDYKGDTILPEQPDKATFGSAYALTLDKMTTKYPNSEIWCATLPPCESNGQTGAPEINDSGVPLADFNERIRRLALSFGVRVLDFAQSGLTYRNLDLYMGDWADATGKGLHPNAAGMSVLANQAIRQMDPFCRMRY